MARTTATKETANETNETANTAADLAANVAPLLVRIGRDARGSGVIIESGVSGKVLTNAHNLRNPTVQVTFADGVARQGSVSAVDVDADLAVITVETTPDLIPLPWADVDPQIGDDVYAVARTSSGPRVTRGNISAVDRAFTGPRGRMIDGSIEHTAPIARGGSGSVLVNADGELVGVNTHRLGDGFYLAVPSDKRTKDRVAKLVAGESPRDLRLGVAVARPDVAQQLRRSVGLADRNGLLVRAVNPDSPAAKAGIKEGDLLVTANGNPLTAVADLESTLHGIAADVSTVSIGLVRGADESVVTVSFVEAPSE
jgi:serine protease Do